MPRTEQLHDIACRRIDSAPARITLETQRRVSPHFDLNVLNTPQREAVTTVEGPLLLLAGAGTGKTRVITYRIAYMTRHGIEPEALLAVTFTNKAAAEMKERVAELVSPDVAGRLTVSTFHSFCARLLRRHIRRLGFSPRFDIATDAYQSGLLRSILSERGYLSGPEQESLGGGPGLNARDTLAAISQAKCELLTPKAMMESAASVKERRTADVYEEYQRRLKSMDLLDFDDLLVLVLRLWQKAPDLLEQHRDRYRYLLVDEYQDTNHVQFKLVATLAGARANLCVVGDDDQSIYGWRGADVGNILSFETSFPQATVIRLEQNYRSTETILRAANHLISHNRERRSKQLWSGKEKGDHIRSVTCHDEVGEASLIAEWVQDTKARLGNRYSDFAVLYRSNHQSRALEAKLRQLRIPYTIVGSRGFYERREVLDAVSFLRAAHNPRDDLAFLRIVNVPPRGMGEKAIERLKELQQVTGRHLQDLAGTPEYLSSLPAETARTLKAFCEELRRSRQNFSRPGQLRENVEQLLKRSGYLDGLGRIYKPRSDALRRRENVLEFISAAEEYQRRSAGNANLGDFLESFALVDSSDKTEHSGPDVPSVTLLTVHAAKGLEFPHVAVVGMEHHLFPHKNSLNEGGLEEERRLFYVALTRAQCTCMLTRTEYRTVAGKRTKRRPSPFLFELPDDLVDLHDADDALAAAPPEVADDFIAQMRAKFGRDT
mgnify:CR=1 FL=1